MSSRLLDHLLSGLDVQNYIRITADGQIIAIPPETNPPPPAPPASERRLIPIRELYLEPTQPVPVPLDIYRELASGPYDRADPHRRRLFWPVAGGWCAAGRQR